MKHILECYYEGSDVDDIASYAHKRSGLGLYFILDGLDEYVPDKGRTCISKLIKKDYLPKSVVMVSSQPAAIAQVQYKATACIEVIGFLKDQIYEYIKEYVFSVESKVCQLNSFLEKHPNVLHMCYLPIHAAMVCFLFNRYGVDLPKTETEIYQQFTRQPLFRAIKL